MPKFGKCILYFNISLKVLAVVTTEVVISIFIFYHLAMNFSQHLMVSVTLYIL